MRSSSAVGERLRAEAREQVVGVHQVDEGGGDRPVLGLAALEQHVRACGDRDARCDVHPRRRSRRPGRALARRPGAPTSRAPAPWRGPTHDGSRQRGERVADADLAGIGDRLDRDRLGRGRPGDEQLAVHAPRREELDRPARDPDRHPQRDGAAGDPQPADPLDRPLHLPARARRTLGLLGAVEEEQQRVAAPLEQPGTPVVRLVEQRREDAVEGVAHQLGADLALAREPLGERREARRCRRTPATRRPRGGAPPATPAPTRSGVAARTA